MPSSNDRISLSLYRGLMPGGVILILIGVVVVGAASSQKMASPRDCTLIAMLFLASSLLLFLFVAKVELIPAEGKAVKTLGLWPVLRSTVYSLDGARYVMLTAEFNSGPGVTLTRSVSSYSAYIVLSDGVLLPIMLKGSEADLADVVTAADEVPLDLHLGYGLENYIPNWLLLKHPELAQRGPTA